MRWRACRLRNAVHANKISGNWYIHANMPNAVAVPMWLVALVRVLCVAGCVLLVMYALNKLECKKFVRWTLGIQATMVALMLFAYWRVGGFGRA